MRRIVVLGALGYFGRSAIHWLEDMAFETVKATRCSRGDIQVDANDPESIRAALEPGDLVIDTAGPFQTRSTALIDAAIEVGFDVIDINDSLTYAEQLLAQQERIERARIAVLSSASSVSALSTAMVRLSGVANPVRLHGFIVPASRRSANVGSALSLIRSVGQPIRVWRDGRFQTLTGWSERRSFPMPPRVYTIQGGLFETADALYLPRIWPSLRDVSTYVDTNTIGLNTLLRWAAKRESIRRLMERGVRSGAVIAQMLGSDEGGLGYEIEDANGDVKRLAIVSSPRAAVEPLVQAVKAIFAGKFEPKGLVSPQEQVEATELVKHLRSQWIQVVEVE